MKILEVLSRHAATNNIRFLVIGGHALNVHGYSRQTGDLDLLVSKRDREFWYELVEQLAYKPFQQHAVFARFTPQSITEWPIDLMFVEEAVFDKLFKDSVTGDFASVEARVPSARHMIALKLHALKQRQAHREEKDIGDVRELLKICSMNAEDLLELCEKYDRPELYEQLKR